MRLRRWETRAGRALKHRATRFVSVVIALVAIAWPHEARAWFEIHVAGDEVRVTLDPSGSARVEHRIRLHISGGPVTSFDLRGVDPDAVFEPDGYVVPAHDGTNGSLENAVPIATELLPLDKPREGAPSPLQAMRVRFDRVRGIPHGAYVLLVRYRTNLLGRGLAVIDGATARIRWDGPVYEDGFDSARVIFDLPSAPTEPKALDAPRNDDEDAPTNPPMFLATLRRGPERDELELLRPYAAKAESIPWAIRADARVLRQGQVAAAASAQPPPAPPSFDLFGPARPTLLFGAGGALFALYAAIVVLKSLEVSRTARAAGAVARPLVPLPLLVRSAGAGLCLTAGVALELLLQSGTAGAALVALAVALGAHATPRWTRPRRGPGRWLPIPESEAFHDPPRPTGTLLDVSTRAGKALFLLSLCAATGGVALVAEVSPYHAWLVGFDAAAVLAIFGTGRLRELPPDAAIASAPFLRDVAKRITARAGEHVRIVPRIRVPLASPDADELRVTVAPRAPLAGLVSIEIGVVFVRGAGGAIALPELLLRVTGGSECERLLEPLARRSRWMRGRRPEERVLSFSPRMPTARMTAAIAIALAAKVSRREEPAASKEKASSKTKGNASKTSPARAA